MKFQSKYNFQNYNGKTINYLTVISDDGGTSSSNGRMWKFRCVCGNIVCEEPSRVINGHKKSCGCMRYKNIVHSAHSHTASSRRINPSEYMGITSYRLTVIGYTDLNARGRLKLKCICDCGNIVEVLPYQIKRKIVKSCGCLNSEIHVTHGLSSHPLYRVWNSMITRCYNPKCDKYPIYGGRGISVCDEWRDSPKSFFEWSDSIGGRPEGTTIDRINPSGDYSPSNCRWLTKKEQNRNKRNNRFVSFNGETKCLAEWSEILNIGYSTLYNLVIKKGKSIQEVIDLTKK